MVGFNHSSHGIFGATLQLDAKRLLPGSHLLRTSLQSHAESTGSPWVKLGVPVEPQNCWCLVWTCMGILLNHIESSSIFWYKFTLTDETVSPTKSSQNLGGQLQLWTCPWSRTEESERPHWRTCVSLARHASRVAGPPANASPSKSSENPVKDLRCYSKWMQMEHVTHVV